MQSLFTQGGLMWTIEESIRFGFANYLSLKPKYKFAGNLTSKSLKNLDDIKYAVYSVYECGVPFQTGKQAYKKYNNAPFNYQSQLDVMPDRIYRYFNCPGNKQNTQNNFDDFHKELCDCFLSLNAYRKADPFTYGNAQKMINMVFKYLSCFEDYDEFADLFSYCHIPVDGYLLDVLSSMYQVNCGERQYNGKPWTQFDKLDYLALVDEYRQRVKKDTELSFLAFDFYAWESSVKKSPLSLPIRGKQSKPITFFKS